MIINMTKYFILNVINRPTLIRTRCELSARFARFVICLLMAVAWAAPRPVAAQRTAYCASGATVSDSSIIYRFSLGNIDSESNDCATYTDYTKLSTSVTTGETVDFRLTLGKCQSDSTRRYQTAKIFVDWDQNGEFDEAAAQTLVTASTSSAAQPTFTERLAIPEDAAPGATRMRIISWEDRRNGTDYPEDVAPCGDYPYGETEDYTLTIQAPGVPVIADAGEDQTVVGDKKDGSASVELDGSGSTGPITTYRWTEDEKELEKKREKPKISFTPGSHLVVLTVSDKEGNTDSDTVQITVTPPAAPVVADAGEDQRLLSTQDDGSALVTLDGTGSTGSITAYRWTEGSTPISENAEPEVLLSVGQHEITLTVTDESGNTDTDIVLIVVNQPPRADAGPDQRTTAKKDGKDVKVRLDASASSDNGGTIVDYAWAWDDQTAEGPKPTVSLAEGTYSITLTVTDDQGATDTDNVLITILPPASTPSPGFTLSASSVTEDEDFAGTRTVSIAPDQDSPSATYSFSPVLSSIDFAEVVYNPAERTIAITATPDAFGEVSINVVATDRSNPNNIALETLLLAVEGVNDPPTRIATLSPLSVRQDSEPRVLDLSKIFSDVDGDELSYTTQSSNPALVIPTVEGSNLLLTTAAGQTGEATVTVSATDDKSPPVSTSFLLTVLSSTTNLPPVADAGEDIRVTDEDGDGEIGVPLNGAGSQDEDGAISRYEWRWGVNSVLGKHPKISLTEGETPVILTVTDEEGETGSDTVMVTVLKAENAPLEQERAKQLGGPGVVGLSNSIADNERNLYLLGSFSGIVDFDPSAASYLLNGGRRGDFFVAKYAPNGSLIFVNQIEVNTLSGESYPENITLDNDQNIFVAASFIGSITLENTTLTSVDNSRDILLARYNADGSLSFAHRLGNSGTEYGHSLATTPDNKILLLGRFQDEVDFDPSAAEARRQAEDWDIYLARFTPGGLLEQVTSFGGDDFQTANRMVVDSEGNIIIAGSYKNQITLDKAHVQESTRNGFVATLRPDLTIRASLPFLTPENPANDPPTVSLSLHTDGENNTVVLGNFSGRLEVADQVAESPGREDNIFIAKLQSDLGLDFFREYGGAYSENATDVLIDPAGHYLLAGTFDNELDLDRSLSEDNLYSVGEINGFLATLDSAGNVGEVQHIKGDGSVNPRQLFWQSDDRSSLTLTGTFKENITFGDGSSLQSLGELHIFIARLLWEVDQLAPTVEPTFPRELIIRNENSLSLAVRATDAGGIRAGRFGYVGLSSADTITLEAIEAEDDTYRKIIAADQLLEEDSLGIRYRFAFTDAAGNTSEASGITYWQYEPTAFSSRRAPAGPWREIGNKTSDELSIADFNILAFPFEAQSASQVLEALGTPSDSLWRLFRYDPATATFPEYGVSSEFSLTDRLEPGQGYFIIMRDRNNVQFGGTVDSLSTTNGQYYHTFTLQPGWNLIGNPFPFTLDWQQVVEFPVNSVISEELAAQPLNRLPNQEGEDDYYTSSQLGAFEGAFLHWKGDNNQTLYLPTTAGRYARRNEGGRQAATATDRGWEVALVLEQGSFRSSRAGIGMRPTAREAIDWHDALSVPKPVHQPELRLDHPEAPLNRSVVPEQAYYRWSGQLVGAPGQEIRLQWDASAVRYLDQGIYLWDSVHHRLVALAEQDDYRVTMPASGTLAVQIFYGSPDRWSQQLATPSAQVGDPYPNPAFGSFQLPLILPTHPPSQPVMIDVYDLQGRLVATQSFSHLSGGYQELLVEMGEGWPSGLYYCHIQLPDEKPRVVTRKIVKR